MQTPNASDIRRRTKRKFLWSGLVLLALLSIFSFKLGREISIERRLNQAVTLHNHSGVVAEQGTNILRSLGDDSLPILLKWSDGKEPPWYPVVNRGRALFKRPPLIFNASHEKEKARAAIFFLREDARSLVPELLQRLSDSNVLTRRFSIHLLGAIGPSIGSNAFDRLTNCLTDPDDHIRNDVIWTLQYHRPGDYPANQLVSVFQRGLKDSFEVTRQNAMAGFARLGTNALTARDSIEAALSDADAGVVHWAERWLKGEYLK